jgi:hypothetical protein
MTSKLMTDLIRNVQSHLAVCVGADRAEEARLVEAQDLLEDALALASDSRAHETAVPGWDDDELITRLVKRSGYSEGEAFAIVTRMSPPPTTDAPR